MAAFASPQLWAWVTIAAAVGFLVWLLSPILMPFLFGAILAYILDPIVERLTNRYFPRTLAVLLVMFIALALLVALLLIVAPLLYKETRLLLDKAPAFLDWTSQHLSPWLKQKLDIDLQLDVQTVKQIARDAFSGNEDLAKRLLSSLGVGGLALLSVVINVVLVPVVLFFLLRD